MSFFKTANGKIVLGAAVSAVAIGYLMKKGREEVKNGKKVEETWAGKLGLIS